MAKASLRTSKPAAAKSGERKPQEERWAEIIEAATDVFWEKGYDAATLQDIANRVGILKGSIYYYIDSKTDLRAHLLEEAHRDGLTMMMEIVESEPRPLHRLYKMSTGHVLHVCGHIARTAVFLREIRRLSDEERMAIGIDDRAFARLFQHCIEEAQAAGLIRKEVDPELAGICTLSSLNSVYTWYSRATGVTPARLAHHLASTIMHGLISPAGLETVLELEAAVPSPSKKR